MSQKPRSTDDRATYFQAILPSLPADLSRELHSIRVGDIASSDQVDTCFDNLIRFVAGAKHSDASKQSPQDLAEWAEKQNSVSNILKNLVGGSISVTDSLETKRRRDEDEDAQDDSSRSAKRAKTQPSVNGAEEDADADSPPLFVLHSLSVTSPVRKKVDIAVHKNSLRLTHPTTRALEARIPLSALRRAFLLPTRGKPKPHWTVVVLSSDVSTAEQSSGKSSAPAAASGSSGGVQLIFGVDAGAPSAMAVTKAPESSAQPQKTTTPKGSPTSVPLRDFLSALSEAKPNGELQILGPTPDVFKSACTSLFHLSLASSGSTSEQSGGVAGIEAYRGAKAGTLWFMKEGILWGESKPCEFWAIEDLTEEGVKTIGSTGRLCTVVISRKRQSEEDEDEEDAMETEFGMVDAREKGPINDWVRSFVRGRTSNAPASRKGKGKTTSKTASSRSSPPSSAAAPPTAERFTINDLHADSDDEEDADFRTDSDASASESSSSEEGGEEGAGEEGEEGSAEGGESEEDEDEDDEEEEELRPERHPLMRSGIMPRMSKAVVDMVVGMVEEEMMGGPDEDDELEEDELDE